MPRRHKSLLVTDADMGKLEDPVNIMSPNRNILVELGHPAPDAQGTRLVNMVQKPELGGTLLIFENEEYEEVPDLAEAPRGSGPKDPALSKPNRRPKK